MPTIKSHGALIIDGLYMAGVLQPKPVPPQLPVTIDYDRFASALLCQAGVVAEEGRYFVDRTPSIDPRFPHERQVAERVRRRKSFHTALKHKKGFDVVLAPPHWSTDECGARVMDDRQLPGALMALMARLLLDRPDITHYVLVAASAAYVPMVQLARAKGVYITLCHLTACDELRHSVDCAIALRRAELAHFA